MRRAVIIAGLGLIATLSFVVPFGSWFVLLAPVGGVLIAGGAAYGGQRFGLRLGEQTALSAAAMVIIGPAWIAAAAREPLGWAWLDPRPMLTGSVNGWSYLLSSQPPVPLSIELAALPAVLAAFSAATGLMLLARDAPLFVTFLPSLATTALGAAMTEPSSSQSLLQGALAAVAIMGCGPLPTRRAAAIGVTAIATAGAFGVSSVAMHRRTLLDYQTRPWEPDQRSSPLADFKASLIEPADTTVVFHIDAPVPLTRWAVARLGTHDGTVWSVDPDQFLPVDESIEGDQPHGPIIEYQITLMQPQHWIPLAGAPRQIYSDTTLYWNGATLASSSTLGAGTVIGQQIVGSEPVDRISFLGASTPALDPAEIIGVELIPPQLRNLAGDLFEGVNSGPARAAAVADRFVQQGFYDHSPATRPGHSLARLEEFLADPNRLIGYGEHYAASAGILTQLAGLPTRVVVGYLIPESRYHQGHAEVYGADAAAWIEILTVEHGWVPLDVTPDQSREPVHEPQGRQINNVAIPDPPPPPPPPPAPPHVAGGSIEDDEPEPHDEATAISAVTVSPVVAGAAVAIGLPPSLLLLVGSAVIGFKAQRCRRRRRQSAPIAQIEGAWQELLDRLRDAGIQPTNAMSAREVIHLLQSQTDPILVSHVEAMAETHTQACYAPTPIDPAQAEQTWQHCDHAVTELLSQYRRRDRWLMRTNPRSLLAHAKVSAHDH